MTTILRAFTAAELTELQSHVGEPKSIDNEARASAAAALRAPVNGESIAMPVVCSGWFERARAVELPKKGEKRARDQEAYMQGALAMAVALGVVSQERGSQIAFMTAVGRLEEYVAAQAKLVEKAGS